MKLEFGPKAYFNFFSHAAFGSNLPVWLKFLWRHKGEIEWVFIPKILYISLIVLFNTPLVIYEALAYGKKIKSQRLLPPLFILGHARSGTTYLHYILSKDRRFAFGNTYETFMPWLFLASGKFTRKIMQAALPETRPMDNLKLGADLPKEEEFAMSCMGEESMVTAYIFPKKMYEYFRKYVLFKEVNYKTVENWKRHLVYFMKKLSYKYGTRPLLLKSPSNTGRVKELLELFPDAKFIHIYRNPYVVYSSNERLYEKTLPNLAFQRAKAETVQDFILQSYRDTYRKYFDDRKMIPKGNLVEFSYEEFIGNELKVLERTYAELALGDFEIVQAALAAQVAEYTGFKTNQYEMDAALKEKIYIEWKFAFEEFGYSK
jgi:hypothetical protein